MGRSGRVLSPVFEVNGVDVEGDLNSLTLVVQRQVLELVALISKYPTRAFAAAGSSAEIAYPALRVFLKEHVVRKMGLLVPLEALSRLHIINGTTVRWRG